MEKIAMRGIDKALGRALKSGNMSQFRRLVGEYQEKTGKRLMSRDGDYPDITLEKKVDGISQSKSNDIDRGTARRYINSIHRRNYLKKPEDRAAVRKSYITGDDDSEGLIHFNPHKHSLLERAKHQEEKKSEKKFQTISRLNNDALDNLQRTIYNQEAQIASHRNAARELQMELLRIKGDNEILKDKVSDEKKLHHAAKQRVAEAIMENSQQHALLERTKGKLNEEIERANKMQNQRNMLGAGLVGLGAVGAGAGSYLLARKLKKMHDKKKKAKGSGMS